ncbi:Mucolipin-2, partial [Symbiodinium microadriaticum]
MAWFRNPRAARGAAEIGAELESQGRQLADRSAAVDLLKRWSERFCNEEGPFPSPEEPHGLCFREILLKSHAFEAQLLYVTGSLEIMNAEASLLFAAGGLRDSALGSKLSHARRLQASVAMCPRRQSQRDENGREMHIVETLFLNPFEKWVHYKRFPCKFFIHLVLSIAVTSQAVIYFQRDIEHVSRTNQHLVHMFTNGDQLHSPDELQRALSNLITNHFLINNRSIVRYELSSPDLLNVNVLFRDGTQQVIPVERGEWLQQKQQDTYLMEHFPFIYDLDLLPLLRELSAQQNFDEIGYICGPEQVSDCFQCIYRWDIVTTFDGWYAGDFRTILDVTATDCQAKEWQYLHVLSISVASLAVISVFLIWRKITRSVKVIRAFRASSQTWAQLSAQDVASMLSVWWAVALASNLIQLVGAIECMRARPEIGQRFMWVGFSCFLTWLNMIQYFESFPSYFIAFHTIARSGIRILQLFFSVAPFFFAFILLGVCLFWKSSMFADPTSAAEMLFSLMNGDSIHEAFREIRSVGGFLLQVQSPLDEEFAGDGER